MRSRLVDCADACDDMENEYSDLLITLEEEQCNIEKIDYKYACLQKEMNQENIKNELAKSHLETKNRLLEEVLTKKNKDLNEVEDNNK